MKEVRHEFPWSEPAAKQWRRDVYKRQVCTPGNPRQATQEDILAIYKSLM